MGSWSCSCNSQGGSNWVCTCHSQGGSNWWTCTDVYDPFYLMNDACPANQTYWTDPTLNTSIRVKALHINELRTAINGEQTRRHTTPHNFGTAKAVGNKILRDDTKDLRDQIEALFPFTGSWAYNYNTISKIEGGILSEVRVNMNDAENNCLCNCNYCTCQCNYCTCDCNYCTCDCNYCTCDCNYCTCDCNYCTCNCNYACTCNCNYSDEELKEGVVQFAALSNNTQQVEKVEEKTWWELEDKKTKEKPTETDNEIMKRIAAAIEEAKDIKS